MFFNYDDVRHLINCLVSAGLSNDEVIELIQQYNVSFEDEFFYTECRVLGDGIYKETLQKGDSGQMWTKELVYPFNSSDTKGGE